MYRHTDDLLQHSQISVDIDINLRDKTFSTISSTYKLLSCAAKRKKLLLKIACKYDNTRLEDFYKMWSSLGVGQRCGTVRYHKFYSPCIWHNSQRWREGNVPIWLCPWAEYLHVKIYINVLPKWVIFLQEIPKHGSHLSCIVLWICTCTRLPEYRYRRYPMHVIIIFGGWVGRGKASNIFEKNY